MPPGELDAAAAGLVEDKPVAHLLRLKVAVAVRGPATVAVTHHSLVLWHLSLRPLSSGTWSRNNLLSSDLPASRGLECATGMVAPLPILWCTLADHAKLFSPPTVSFSQPMAGFRFFVAGCYQPQSYPAQRQHAALRTFYPENLPFFCYDGCSGIGLGVVGFLTMDHL